MTITLNELIEVSPIFQKLATQPFPGKTVFKIAKIMKAIDNEVACFETARKGVIERYGARKENGELDVTEDNQVKIQPDKIEDCNREMVELLTNEIELDVTPIPMSCFDEVELTPSDVIRLEKFIEE